MADKEIEIELKSPYLLVLLGFLLLVLYFELNVAIPSPIAFGDEGFHTHLARWIAQNVEYPIYQPLYGTLLQKQGYSRPPLFNLFEASFYFIFGFNELIVKILVPLISFFLALAAFVLFKRLYSPTVGFIAAVLIATVPQIVTYSVLFYVDIFFVYWVLFAVGFFLLAVKEGRRKYFLFSAVFTAFAILTKTPGFLIILFYGLYFLYEVWQKKNLVWGLKKYVPLGIIVLAILGTFFLRNFVYYGTPVCGLTSLFPAGKCNVDITYKNQEDFTSNSGTSTGSSVYDFGLTNYFNFAYGFLWFVPLFFFVGAIYVYMQKEKTGIAAIIFLLASLPLFLLTFQGRAEDASRYTLLVFPFMALLTAIYFEKIMNWLKRYYKYFGIIFLFLILAVSYYNFSSKILTLPQVKAFSPLFLQACQQMSKNLPQNAIILSLNTHPTVYNCQRESIWELQDLPDIILSNNVTLVKQRLDANGINYVFVQKFAMSNQAHRASYPLSFISFLEQNPATFKKILENGPDYNTCVNSGGCDGVALYQVLG